MNELQVFNYKTHEVRTVQRDGEPWFVLRDVCQVLDISHVKDTADRLDRDEVGQTEVIDSLGRKQTATIINESGLYNVILRSDKPEAKPFRKWVTSDVLPAIRKYGFYGTPATIDAILWDPDFGIRLLSEYKAEKERNKALAAENEAQKQIIADYEPKVQYVDKILSSKGTLTVKQIAADYDMTAQELNKILHEERIQYKVNDQWILYKEHMGMGYTKSNPVPIVRSDGRDDFKLSTKWTQKGRLFIHELLKKRGIIAVIDRKLPGEQMAI